MAFDDLADVSQRTLGRWRSCDRRRREVHGGVRAVAHTREESERVLDARHGVQNSGGQHSRRQCRWQQLGACRIRGGSLSRKEQLEACDEARLMDCERAEHDVSLRAQVARGILSSYGSGRHLDVFWPHMVSACACELAKSKYTEPHFRPKRTLAATHISDWSYPADHYLAASGCVRPH